MSSSDLKRKKKRRPFKTIDSIQMFRYDIIFLDLKFEYLQKLMQFNIYIKFIKFIKSQYCCLTQHNLPSHLHVMFGEN